MIPTMIFFTVLGTVLILIFFFVNPFIASLPLLLWTLSFPLAIRSLLIERELKKKRERSSASEHRKALEGRITDE